MSQHEQDFQLPTEIQAQLDRLQVQDNLLQRFIDTERYPAGYVTRWLGNAIISLMRDEAFNNNDESEEAFEMLALFYDRSYTLLVHLENVEE